MESTQVMPVQRPLRVCRYPHKGTSYATLHAAKAALYVRDVVTASHAAVRRMFDLHLIQSGELEAEWASHLGEIPDDRLAADFDVVMHFPFVVLALGQEAFG